MFAKIFRNTLIASSLLVGASLLAGPAVQAQVTDDGVVTGTVEAISDVTYTAPAAAILSPTAGNDNMDFGDVNIANNSNAGWTLAVASTNGSTLDHATLGSIAYSALDFTSATAGNSLAVTPGTLIAPVTVYDPAVLTCAEVAGCDAAITADILAADIDGMAPGNYVDTLTFTLTTKN